MGKSVVIIIFIIAFGISAQGQETVKDTVPVNKQDVHSPKKATVYSAILPGLGQAYNKKYWKIPIIYVGFGVIIYYIDWNNSWYSTFKNAYRDLSLADQTFNSSDYIAKYEKLPFLSRVNYGNLGEIKNTLESLTKYQDYYRRNRDLLIIGTAVFYAMNIIDASVDAHLFNFDISDDLTMNWKPAVATLENQRYLCLNWAIKF